MTNKEVTFDRRNYYIGETLNQMRHGYGVYFYKNKFFRYEGDWVKGKKHGHGLLHMEDGSYYEGEFKDGEIEGHGFRKWQHSGNCYSGEFCKGEMQGHGVMNYANGTQYQGEFFQNQCHGNGILKGPGNLVYEGSWYKNKKHGQGIQEFDNGDEYEGDWVEGKRQGHGEMKYANGSIYEGQWRNDMCNGQGLISHISGVVYEGLWINSLPAVEPSQLIANIPDEQTYIEILQGDRFSVQLRIVDSTNEPIEGEYGREFKASAGYKFSQSSKTSQSQSLLGLIEGIETKPMKTPFGFDVLPYPLIKLDKDENESGDINLKRKTASSPFNPRLTTSEIIHESKESASEASKNDDATVDNPDLELSSSHSGSKPEISDAVNDNDDDDSKTTPSSPAPCQRASKDGTVQFDNLLLPCVPDGFRPFLADDEVYSSTSSTPTGSTQSTRRGASGAASFSMRSEKKRSRGSRTTSAASSSSTSLTADGKGGKGKNKGSENDEKSLKSAGSHNKKARENKKRASSKKSPSKSRHRVTEEDQEDMYEPYASAVNMLYAQEGEYVIIVEEVTNPPFMGKLLPPAFVIVRVTVPKKTIKKKKGNAN